MNRTPGLKAVGINCTSGRLVEPLLRSLNGLEVPLVLYPNGEEVGNKNCRLSHLAQKWLAIHPNVFALGGCCHYNPQDIQSLNQEI